MFFSCIERIVVGEGIRCFDKQLEFLELFFPFILLFVKCITFLVCLPAQSPKSLLQDDDYLRRNGVLDRSYAVGFTNQEGLGIADYIFAIPEG